MEAPMKRLFCLLLILMLLPLPALGEDAAIELNVPVMDNRTQLDSDAIRDRSDDTGYDPRVANSYAFSADIPAQTPLQQVFMRMNALPDAVEIQQKNASNKWTPVAALANPGPEFVITAPAPLTGPVRLVIRFAKNAQLHLKELRLFGPGQLPRAVHAWQSPEESDVLLLADAPADLDLDQLAACCETGRSVAVATLTRPAEDYLAFTDSLWNAGLRAAPLYGSFRATEGDASQKLKAWHDSSVTKILTSWVRRCQPLLAVAAGAAVEVTLPAALEHAFDYNYETEDAALYSLWITPESCAADDPVSRIAALAPRSFDALRAWCAEDFATVQHADPAAIPYPANRLEDGYLPEGEFVHEDPENGLWAYLSPTVQVEIIRCEQPEFPRLWYQTDVKFKPESEQFKQVVYSRAAFKDQQIYPETLAQTSNMVIAINGDYYPYRLDRKQAAGNILRSGKVLYDYSNKNKRNFPNLDTMALLDNGALEVFAGDEITATQLLERGDVHDALSFGPYLARDGKLRIYDGYSWEMPEPRTAVGMIAPGHYRILTVEGRMPNKGPRGLNINDLAKLMYAQGVTDAFNLDGGSTAVLIFMGRKLNLTGKDTSIGKPRNQHELFGVGTSLQTHTDMIDYK